MRFKYGLKAQKLLAQGIALSIMTNSKAPCKGKSFVICLVFESFCPYRLSRNKFFFFVSFSTKYLVVTIIYCRFAADFLKKECLCRRKRIKT